MRSPWTVRLGAALVAVLVACTAYLVGHHSAPRTATTATTSNALTIANFRFVPDPLNARVGDTITVTNTDGTDHSVTADDKSFDTGHFSTGTRTITLSTAGTITFHCDVHTYMTGVIHVTKP